MLMAKVAFWVAVLLVRRSKFILSRLSTLIIKRSQILMKHTILRPLLLKLRHRSFLFGWRKRIKKTLLSMLLDHLFIRHLARTFPLMQRLFKSISLFFIFRWRDFRRGQFLSWVGLIESFGYLPDAYQGSILWYFLFLDPCSVRKQFL